MEFFSTKFLVIKNLFQLQVVHVKQVMSKEIKNQNYNCGNVSFELILQSNSKVTILGHFEDAKDIDLVTKPIALCKVPENINQKVCVSAYVKTELGKFSTKDSSFTIGSITDGMKKVEVRCNIVSRLFDNLIPKGSAVMVTGRVIKYVDNPPYIQISSRNDYMPTELNKKLDMKELFSVFECYE